MKKLLSILSISATVGFTSSNVISCGIDDEGLNKINKVDIKNQMFNPVSVGDINANNCKLYDYTRKEIGSWADPAISSETVKNDNEISVEIYLSNGDLVNDIDVISIISGNYTVKIEITKNDKYFLDQTETEYNLAVSI